MIKNIIIGIQSYFGAYHLISKLKLWKYFAIPMFLSLITWLLIFGLTYQFYDRIGGSIAKIWPWDFGQETFAAISNFFGGLVILVLGFILFRHIVMMLSGPFMSPVSEKIESHLTGKEIAPETVSKFIKLLFRSIKVNGRNLIMELFISIPLLLLSFIPAINIITTVLLLLVQAYYAGFGNMDYTLERHFSYKKSVQFVRKNRGAAIGNGLVFTLFLLVPFIGVILVLPLSVTASTMHTLKILNENSKDYTLKTID